MSKELKHLQLLADLVPFTRQGLADAIGIRKANLIAGLKGRRPIPKHANAKLHDILGVNSTGVLAKDRVHFWRIGDVDVQGQALIDAIKLFFQGDIYVCNEIFCEGDQSTETAPLTPIYAYGRYYVLVQMTDPFPEQSTVFGTHNGLFSISPDWIGGEWYDGHHKDEESPFIYTKPTPFEVDKITFEALVAGRFTPERFAEILHDKDLEKWTWDRITKEALRAGMTPEDVANRLGFGK